MIRKEDVYRIGRLGKPHGVKGEVTFQFDDDVLDRVDSEYLILSVSGILVPFFIEEYRFHGRETALVKFCDVDSQERAAGLTGCDVYFPRSLSDSDDSDISWAEIIGYSLVNSRTGKYVGKIASVNDTTANILFELEDGKLIPASEELIADVDTEHREIKVYLPDGLLDI